MPKFKYFYFLFSLLQCYPRGLEDWFDDEAFKEAVDEEMLVIYCEEDDVAPQEESIEEEQIGLADIIIFVSICFTITSLIFCVIKCSERFSFQ